MQAELVQSLFLLACETLDPKHLEELGYRCTNTARSEFCIGAVGVDLHKGQGNGGTVFDGFGGRGGSWGNRGGRGSFGGDLSGRGRGGSRGHGGRGSDTRSRDHWEVTPGRGGHDAGGRGRQHGNFNGNNGGRGRGRGEGQGGERGRERQEKPASTHEDTLNEQAGKANAGNRNEESDNKRGGRNRRNHRRPNR